MTEDQILTIGKQVGLGDAEGWINEEYDYKNEILAFAALVAAAEREACAKVCEDSVEYAGDELARQIRARGNT
jgi:hypothetical protein